QNQPIQSERAYILKRSKTKHLRFHLCFVNFRSRIQFQPYTVLQASLFPSLMFSPVLEGSKKTEKIPASQTSCRTDTKERHAVKSGGNQDKK
ncbi:MAG: hypothetical protein ACOCOT_08050, partial [Prevotella sp.]